MQIRESVINVLSLIERKAIQEGIHGYNVDPYPTVGSLYISKSQLGYVSGYLRMRGRDNGKYPYKYLDMIDYIFGVVYNTIEICSNSVSNKNCYTVDINPKYNPSFVANAETLEGIADSTFNRARIDPPYNEKTAKSMYDTDMPNISKVLESACRVVKPKSLIFLLLGNTNRQSTPEGLKRIGHIAISVIPSNEIRCLHVYYKLPVSTLLTPDKYVKTERVYEESARAFLVNVTLNEYKDLPYLHDNSEITLSEDCMSKSYTKPNVTNVKSNQSNVQQVPEVKQSTNEIVMSVTARRNLDLMKRERARRQSYIPMDTGVTKRLQFDPEKMKIEDKVFNGKTTQRVAYTVVDTADLEAREKVLSLTFNQSKAIDEALEDNYRILDITKIGEGFSLKYEVSAIE